MTSSGKLCLEHQYKGDAIHGMAGREKRRDVWRTRMHGMWALIGAVRNTRSVCSTRAGRSVGERRVAHTAAAVHEAIAWIGARTGAPPDAIAVAIETPRGVAGRYADRSGVSGLRDQSETARSVSRSLYGEWRERRPARWARARRRPAHGSPRAFRRVQPDDPAIIQLRELCRIVEELQEQEQRLANRLRDQLFRLDAPRGSRSARPPMTPGSGRCCARRPIRRRGRGSRAGASRRPCGRIAFGASRSRTSWPPCASPA